MRAIVLLLGFSCCCQVGAQDYTTPEQFAFAVDSNLVYGADTNYAHHIDTLKLDLYTPLGNTDTQRPLLVLVHGGSWLAGCKNDPASGVVAIAREMVKRGYVVACVNYRLGWHKDDYVPTPAGQPIWPDSYRAFYAADPSELDRAIYRGTQDVKGSIRWLKARADQDSVCIGKVFVGGESAGAFIAIAAGFLDRASEKPEACGALADAPLPGSNLLNITGFECVQRTIDITSGSLQRPDLGPVEGYLDQNGFDARVKGVVSFFGGVPAEAFSQDWWQGLDTPAVYLYHQTCDGIVLFDQGQPMSTISNACNLGYTPWHTNYPVMFGSGAISAAFDAAPSSPTHFTDFEYCPAFDWTSPLLECSRYASNGSYHFIQNVALRAVNVAAFLAPFATDPSECLTTSIKATRPENTAGPYPDPTHGELWIPQPKDFAATRIQLFDRLGRSVDVPELNSLGSSLHLILSPSLPNGCYTLALDGNEHVRRWQVLLLR